MMRRGRATIPPRPRLRERLKAGQDVSAWAPHLPDAKPVFLEDLETAILSRLRMLPKEAFAALPDCAEGLENVLYKAVHSEATLDDILAAAKSKRYPMSRLRRMLLCAALGVQKSDGLPPYLRVLAANERGRALLHTMRETASLPVITKPADAREMPEFCLTADAHDLYVLAQPDKTPGQDWRHSPVMLLTRINPRGDLPCAKGLSRGDWRDAALAIGIMRRRAVGLRSDRLRYPLSAPPSPALNQRETSGEFAPLRSSTVPG